MNSLKILSLILSCVSLGSIALARPQIPEVTLASCQVSKDLLVKWFPSWYTDKAPINKVVGPMEVDLNHVNLAREPGVANYYRLSIKGFDADHKVVLGVHRLLQHLAVNYSRGTYSVGYAPYDVTATSTLPFTLLIEKVPGGNGVATGTLAVVPLQSAQPNPFDDIKMECTVHNPPSEPISVTADDLQDMSSKDQFEVLYDLYRLGFTGRLKGENTEVPASVLKKVKKQLAAYIAKKELPPLSKWEVESVDHVVAHKNTCKDVKLENIQPIYDSISGRKVTAGETVGPVHIGYYVTSAKCTSPARTLVYKPEEDGTKRPNTTDTWSVREIILTTEGLVPGYEFAPSEFHLY